jgi:hypothetical protein
MMKTVNRRSVPFLVLCLGALVPLALVAAPETAKPAYTLFMGADIALERGNAFHRVEDVLGDNFKIVVEGKEVFISTEQGTARMRIDNGLKLAGSPVGISDLNVERTYTLGRDPRRRFSNMAGMSMGTTVAADGAMGNIDTAQLALRTAMASDYTPPEQIAAMQSNVESAQNAASAAFSDPGSDLNSVGVHADRLAVELAKEEFDAIELSMEVSSPVPLDNPYVLVIARIQERDEKPGVFRNWIYAKKLDPIGTKPTNIHINKGGLPVGYKLEDYQVRIYNQGREMPTSHSPRRVNLTRDQAQQYVVIGHVAANKDATLPALPVFGEAPADLKTRVAAGEFAQPFYVKVDAAGNAMGTFTDKECKRAAADPYVEAFVADVLFAPALEKGKPVDGVARMELAKLLN